MEVKETMKIRMLGATVGFSLLALAGLSACGGGASATSSGAPAAAPATQTITVEVLNGELATTRGLLGPDGRGHDMLNPSNLSVKAGQSVEIKFVNYDEGQHTFTIPELGINQLIAAHVDDNTPSTTVMHVTFNKAGTYRWFCALPCDGGQGGWAMTSSGSGQADQNGYMAGTVTVQ